MEIVQAIGIFAIFAVCVVLMMMRKLPTILALPIMAVGIALVAGIPFISSDAEAFTVAKNVLEAGSMRMSTAIAGLFFGGIFGKVLTKIGVTRTIIRKAAELAGDKPLPIALAFLVVCSLIFAASNGLGMVILVGTIIIPIMISAGVSPMVAGAVLLFSNGIGVTFSVGTLGVYIDTLGLPLETVTAYSWMCGIPLMVIAVVWIVFYIKRGTKTRKAWAMPASEPAAEKNVRAIALISPIIPVVLVFAFSMPLVPSIVIGIVAALILATPKNPVQVVTGSVVEGIQDPRRRRRADDRHRHDPERRYGSPGGRSAPACHLRRHPHQPGDVRPHLRPAERAGHLPWSSQRLGPGQRHCGPAGCLRHEPGRRHGGPAPGLQHPVRL